ncbi:MAG: response regulator [Chloroflexota bacterium]
MLKILIVDDEPEMQELFRLMLVQLETELYYAQNGEEAVEIATVVQPDIILMDLMMPVLGGLEACRQLKSNPATASTPIIIVSAMNQHQEVDAAKEAGAFSYLSKPFRSNNLIQTIEKATLFKDNPSNPEIAQRI